MEAGSRANGVANARPVVAASAIGTVIEWYNFALYGAASALVINRLFFPDAGELVGTLAAFATSPWASSRDHSAGSWSPTTATRWPQARARFHGGAYGVIDRADRGLAHLRRDRDLSPVLLVLLRLLQGSGLGPSWRALSPT